jgi:hypothetical protein
MSCVRIVFSDKSASACSDIPESPIWMTGTLDALKFKISGGSMPGGSSRVASPVTATTCALAVSTLAPGCR